MDWGDFGGEERGRKVEYVRAVPGQETQDSRISRDVVVAWSMSEVNAGSMAPEVFLAIAEP